MPPIFPQFRHAGRKSAFDCLRFVSMLCLLTSVSSLIEVETLEGKTFEGLPVVEEIDMDVSGMSDYRQFAFVQNDDGLILGAGNTGLLVYDSVTTKEYELDGSRQIQFLQRVGDGAIYGLLGRQPVEIVKDASGAFTYRPLIGLKAAQKLPSVLLNFLVAEDGETFYLMSHFKAYKVYKGDITQIYQSEAVLSSSFILKGDLYFAHGDLGLLRYDGVEAPEVVPGSGKFVDANAQTIISGFAREDEAILLTVNKGLFRFIDGNFTALRTELDKYMHATRGRRVIPLPNGRMALIMSIHGLFVLENNGEVVTHLTESFNLYPSNPNSTLVDTEGGFWVKDTKKIHRVDTRSRFTTFDIRSGLYGHVNAMIRHQGHFLIATSGGLFTIEQDPVKGAVIVPFIEMPFFSAADRKVTGLYESADQLLITTKYTISAYRDGQLVLIADELNDPVMIEMSAHPGQFLVVTRKFVGTLLWDGENWKLQRDAPWKHGRVFNILEYPENVFWMGNGFAEVDRIDYRSGEPEIQAFGPANGLPEEWVSVVQHPDGIYFRTHSSILEFDNARNRFSELPPNQKPFYLSSEEIDEIHVEKNGDLWVDGFYTDGVLRLGEDGQHRWEALPTQELGGISFNTVWEDEDSIWFAVGERIQRLRVGANYQPHPIKTKVRTVLEPESKVERHPEAYDDAPLRFLSNPAPLRINFALISFENESKHQYQTYLEGFDSGWSDWSSSPTREFTNLPGGDYIFHVRGRNIAGKLGSTDSFAFSVLIPWYFTWWAYVLYAIIAFLAVLLIVKSRLKSLSERNRELEEAVAARTKDVRRQAEKLTTANEDLSLANQLLKDTSKKLRRSVKDLEEANEAKNEFIGIASHDLRNPLSCVIQLAEYLENDLESLSREEIKDDAKNIRESSELMLSIITNLLNIHRIEQGQLIVDAKPVNIPKTAQKAIETHMQRARRKQIELLYEGTDKPLMAIGQEDILTQIFDNLISNALKYSHSGTCVRINTYSLENNVVFEVKDEGMGIPANEMSEIFAKFARISNRPTGDETSTGLGLAIVKKMAEAMQGTVSCQSVAGEGSTFQVSFPLNR